jgi:hypothetical protein
MISQNKLYTAMLPIWKKCRLAVEGEDAIKRSDMLKTIVPPLSEQTDEEYTAMVSRGSYFGATGRTVDGLIGMAFRKPIVVKAPSSLQPIIDDMMLSIDNKVSLNDLCRRGLDEDVTVGRVGYLVEYPDVSTAGMSAAKLQASMIRPYVAEYLAETIIDWRYERVGNGSQLTMVRLIETVEGWGDDMVTRTEIQQERRLLLIDGQYVQRIYRQGTQFGVDKIPLMNGEPLKQIPFFCDLESHRPPILDLANVNLHHFAMDVEHKNAAHFIGTPTPMFAGFQFAESDPFRLGATGGYASQNPDATWGFLEFEGAGLTELREIKKEMVEQMSILGARFLEAEKSGVEALETVKLRRTGETSVLANIVNKRSTQMQDMLRLMAAWQGVSGEITVAINTDFDEAGLSPQDKTALFQMLQGGAISEQTYFYNMQRGEMYEPGTTFEDEQDRIRAQAPAI